MRASEFIHLRVHTAYSLLEGAIQVKALAKLCAGEGFPAVAVTDSNNLFGALEASEALAAMDGPAAPGVAVITEF